MMSLLGVKVFKDRRPCSPQFSKTSLCAPHSDCYSISMAEYSSKKERVKGRRGLRRGRKGSSDLSPAPMDDSLSLGSNDADAQDNVDMNPVDTATGVNVPTGSKRIDNDQMTLILQVISSSKKAMEKQLTDFKNEIRSNHEEVTERMAKKMKRGKALEFKKKGNELQFKFNEEVIDNLEDVEEELERFQESKLPSEAASPLKKVKEALKTGKELLENRQKLIKMADRSQYGWDVVKEYQTDELADGSDDEKRIQKAEKAAKKRAAEKKKSMTRKTFSKASFSYRHSPYQPFASAKGDYYRPRSLSASWEPHTPYVNGVGRSRNTSQVVGPCHSCGEFGHFHSSCPKLRPAANKYPFSSESRCTCMYNIAAGNSCGAPCDVHVTDGTVFDTSLPNVGDSSSEPFLFKNQLTERSEGDIGVCVKGRLHSSLSFWVETLKAPAPIISIIKQGYILPFVSVPEEKFFNNQRSAFEHHSFVSSAISDLLRDGCVKQVPNRPVVCSPLLVVVSNSGKKRLVINLRYLNLFLWKEKFKYEDMRTALEKKDFLCTFDVKSGYHHVDIHENSQQFLGFAWDQSYYIFTVLPFGLSTAFTKLLRPLVKFWRSSGIRSVMFLDNGIVISKGFERARQDSSFVRWSLEAAGFVVNDIKSCWEPSTKGRWLGFELDLELGHISVPSEKIIKLKDSLAVAKEAQGLQAKTLASIVGRIISMSLGLRPIVRLRTRGMYALLNGRSSWFDQLNIDEDTRSDIIFWLDCIERFNGRSLWKSPSAVRIVYSDASGTGYAGYTVEHGCHIALGQWTKEEREKSSTWRELAAVAKVLEAVSCMLRDNRVKWFTDNQNVVHIISVGSRVEELQALALRIFEVMFNFNICIEPEWVPRESNVVADALSRVIDYDDWSINPQVFYWLDLLWGPHSVDRFTSDYNAQLPRFNSRFWIWGTEAVDAFNCPLGW